MARRLCWKFVATSHRDRRAKQRAQELNWLAVLVARAMAHRLLVVVTLRSRPVRVVRGVISMRRRDGRPTVPLGESNLIFTIDGEDVPLERVASIRRARDTDV